MWAAYGLSTMPFFVASHVVRAIPGSVVLVVLSALLVSACSSVPAKLAYQPESALIAYPQALAEPAAYLGKPVRWSGLIVQTRVQAANSDIEVVYLPLKANGQPVQQEDSPGRFIIRVHGMLDPELYAKGRSISVVGELAASVEGHIGQQSYRYPVVNAKEHLLWPKVKEVEVRYVRDPFDGFGLHP